ncbi:MAG: dTDP-4-dehydrorhamnose 3,5-epimerase [Anaerolineae bacterium]|nr:dTDP-4-dehydrorhamnose 3,5-epimerase [Anaerolineae bacterium]
MPFAFEPSAIPEVVLVKPRVFGDQRGFFLETYKHADFETHGISVAFVQANHSRSEAGVLRGLHYQKPPIAQGKLISAVRGAIFDVAVDIRHGSPTFGQWVGEILSDENHHLLYVPPGFAHGFCVLSAVADVVYQVSAAYAPDHDTGILWNDPDIGINWPVESPKLSGRDTQHPCLRDAPVHFVYTLA